MFLLETAATGVTQLRISLPSSSTEQAPHCARPQPKRGPCRCNSLCRTYSNGVSSDAVTECTRPLTLIFNLLAMFPLQSMNQRLRWDPTTTTTPIQRPLKEG